MSDQGWKRVERAIAYLIGGQRVPVTGRGRGDAPDIAHETFAVEVKHRRNLPQWLHDALDQADASARKGQTPIAVLHQHRQRYRDSLVVMRLGDFIAITGPRGSPESGESTPE